MDSLRQSLFSSLLSRAPLDGMRVLDLYAGSGAYGLEALSRGADSVTWVERDRRALDCLRTNLKAVQRSDPDLLDRATQIFSRGVEHYGAPPGSFDLILCDPPYEAGGEVLDDLWERFGEWLDPQTPFGLVWETPGENRRFIPAGWEEVRVMGGGRNEPSLLWVRPGEG